MCENNLELLHITDRIYEMPKIEKAGKQAISPCIQK